MVKTPLYSFANFCLKLARKWPLDGLNYSLDSPKNEKENALIVKTKRHYRMAQERYYERAAS